MGNVSGGDLQNLIADMLKQSGFAREEVECESTGPVDPGLRRYDPCGVGGTVAVRFTWHAMSVLLGIEKFFWRRGWRCGGNSLNLWWIDLKS